MIPLPDPQSTEDLGLDLASRVRAGDVIALYGDLGAGKTSLARGIIRGLGHDGEVASPTFPIVQVYQPPDTRLPVWHVDLYRIEHEEEFEELGLDEAVLDSVLLIEWPERLPVLWPNALKLRLDPAEGGGRALTAEVPNAWGSRWPPR